MRAALPLTDSQGRLVLSQSTAQDLASQSLIDHPETGNILEISEDEDGSERFQEYVVKGQGQGDGGSWDGSTISPMGKATDPNIDRFRQVAIMAEGKATASTCKLRATWEAQVRAGRAKTYTVTVRGWFQNETGPVWDINQLVDVISPAWELNSRMLITGVEHSLDENGRITVLELKHPDTYKPNPTEPTKEESK
jgi:prophage tail gpP-like protein